MTVKIEKSLTYKDAGVDIDAGDLLVQRIKKIVEKTKDSSVISHLGGFGAAYEIPSGYKKPVLVSGADGVGSKLRLAILMNKHDTIGIDLVAMCVNDVLVCGAKPLFFLDYYATGKLNVAITESVIAGIGQGCKIANCSLVGGETAEMPGIYHGEDYDLAGFCVGIVEKERMIDGSKVQTGDVMIALPSSGMHSNGYSLIRKILDDVDQPERIEIQGRQLLELLLEPTRIYVRSVLKLIQTLPVHALSHITGGGLLLNIPRTLPKDKQAVIDTTSWHQNELFHWIQKQGRIETMEMYRTFNCGVGMVIVVPKETADASLELLKEVGETPWIMGVVQDKPQNSASVIFS